MQLNVISDDFAAPESPLLLTKLLFSPQQMLHGDSCATLISFARSLLLRKIPSAVIKLLSCSVTCSEQMQLFTTCLHEHQALLPPNTKHSYYHSNASILTLQKANMISFLFVQTHLLTLHEPVSALAIAIRALPLPRSRHVAP